MLKDYLHAGGRQGSELFLHAVGNAGEHSGTARENDVAVEIATDVEIALENGVVRRLMDTGGLETEERGLEESFGGTEPTSAA